MNAFKCIWRTLSITMRTLRLVFLPAIFIPVCDSPNLRNIINLRYADDTTLMTENEEELKSLFMRVKEEHEKAGLKLNIQEMKITASSPITSWQIEGEKAQAVTEFTYQGFKTTEDGDCCHEMMGPNAMIFVFRMLSFKPTFSLSSFTLIKRLFSSSLSVIKVVSSVYLRLPTFLPATLIPACASPSLAFCMMYSAYKLSKQGDNTQS